MANGQFLISDKLQQIDLTNPSTLQLFEQDSQGHFKVKLRLFTIPRVLTTHDLRNINTDFNTIIEYVNNQITNIVENPDGKVLVDTHDTTPDYLGLKIVAGSGINITTMNVNGDEYLLITATGTGSGGTNGWKQVVGNGTTTIHPFLGGTGYSITMIWLDGIVAPESTWSYNATTDTLSLGTRTTKIITANFYSTLTGNWIQKAGNRTTTYTSFLGVTGHFLDVVFYDGILAPNLPPHNSWSYDSGTDVLTVSTTTVRIISASYH